MRVDAGPEEDVSEGRPRCVTVNGVTYALFRVAGKVYCTDNRCTHMGGPLCQGSLREATVTCPWHGSRFDVQTGQVAGPPARAPVATHPVTLEGGRVWIDFP